MATKLTRFGANVDPTKWKQDFLDQVVDAGDEKTFLKPLFTKYWKKEAELRDAILAGSMVEFSVDEKVIAYKLIAKTPLAKSKVKELDPKLVTMKWKSSGRAKPKAGESNAEKIERGMKYLDAAGDVKDGVFLIVEVASAANPLGVLVTSAGLIDKAIGVGIGLASNRRKWGEEIYKSALSRLWEFGKDKLHARKLEVLKKNMTSDVRARAEYVAMLTKDLNTIQSQHEEFRQKEVEITEQVRQLSVASHEWMQQLKDCVAELKKAMALGVTMEQFSQMKREMDGLIKAQKELEAYREKYVFGGAKDLWERGAPSINEAAKTISELEKEISDATSTDWFAKKLRELQSGGGGDREDSTEDKVKDKGEDAAEVAEDLSELYETATEVLEGLKEAASEWNIGGALWTVFTSIPNLFDLKKTIDKYRADKNKWQTEQRGIWDALEGAYNRWHLASPPTEPSKREAWLKKAEIELAKMNEDVEELKRKQTAMEDVAVSHNENIQRAYRESEKLVKKAKADYQRLVQSTQKRLKHALEVLKNPRFKDKLRRRELQSERDTIVNRQKASKQELEEKIADLKKLEDWVAEENTAVVEILNEGIGQDINQRAIEIEALEKKIAALG